MDQRDLRGEISCARFEIQHKETQIWLVRLTLPDYAGDPPEVRRLRGTFHPPGLLHEQRWRPGGPRRRLCHPRIPQEPQAALQ